MKEELRHGRQRKESHSVYSVYLTAMGREEEAVSEIRMAQELDPLSLPINTDVGFELYYSGHYEQAIEQLQFVLDLNPRFPLANLWMGRAYQQKRHMQRHLHARPKIAYGGVRVQIAEHQHGLGA